MSNTRILVVEDEILIAREIEGCLCQLGYEVVGLATKATTALRQIAEAQPDLVLLDIRLKGDLDGISVAEQMHDRFQIPFIYLTAYVDDETLERAKLTHPSGYILKPFKQNDLRVAVEIALARHQAEAKTQKTHRASTDHLSFEYLSILSHELRNPLAAIQLSTAMLGDSRYPIGEAKKEQLLQCIQASTSSMTQLIEDVMTMGQADHHETLIDAETIELVEFCQTLLRPLQCHPSRQHTVTFSYPAQRIFAKVDQKLLRQLLNNLISNAIKYSPMDKLILLKLYRTHEAIYFEVHDSGIGIPPEDLEHLFQPFQRGKNVGKLPGTGLGLAIAKRAAELHAGEITVESQIGRGTTFTVKLPSHH
ncbi:MAG: response regulator [Stenomitos rutilans HA7619-LM2]|nr:response regulator [Stenomitos rutilans HA7619-LM2]